MKEAYVTFDTAKLLKEKGFDWKCRCFYRETDVVPVPYFTNPKDNFNNPDECNEVGTVSAPTQQMACRWLREERGIHIYPIPVTGFNYVVSVYAEQGNKTYDRILSRSGRNAYEDATNAALEYCLTNLI